MQNDTRFNFPALPPLAARLGRRLPTAPLAHAANPLLKQVFSKAIEDGELDFLEGRKIALHIEDTGLAFGFRLHEGRLRCASPAQADVTISGPAAGFIMLSAKRMDADTLFFQRVLVMKGDTELGLGVKYLLEAMPLHALPRPLRDGLQWLAARLENQLREPSMPAVPRQ